MIRIIIEVPMGKYFQERVFSFADSIFTKGRSSAGQSRIEAQIILKMVSTISTCEWTPKSYSSSSAKKN